MLDDEFKRSRRWLELLAGEVIGTNYVEKAPPAGGELVEQKISRGIPIYGRQ
jgi:hypothetical protein